LRGSGKKILKLPGTIFSFHFKSALPRILQIRAAKIRGPKTAAQRNSGCATKHTDRDVAQFTAKLDLHTGAPMPMNYAVARRSTS
jgi:hypothetical protein